MIGDRILEKLNLKDFLKKDNEIGSSRGSKSNSLILPFLSESQKEACE